ncbi:hypothetical protein G7Y89_g6478 [Cudoniella acicularis]|uniref:Uncharacterized protein n=1 Tax=Cudoniella acicularis TaxID=354080 RepID=A0A8H4RMP3_9HELO|nr:hypothetical protein G7Y89_g6478 [Cudoniella acicularis]
MSGWGSYFASYVKKNDDATTTTPSSTYSPAPKPLQVNMKSFEIKPFQSTSTFSPPPKPPARSLTLNSESTVEKKEEGGFMKRSNSLGGKKLYNVGAGGPQRSNSNAARMAKLFGYAPASAPGSNKAPEPVVEEIPVAVAAEKKETPAPAVNKVEAAPKAAAAGKSQRKGTMEAQLDELMAELGQQVGTTVEKKVEKAEQKGVEGNANKIRKKGEEGPRRTPKASVDIKSKGDVLSMLDFFASQSGEWDMSMSLPGEETPASDEMVVDKLEVLKATPDKMLVDKLELSKPKASEKKNVCTRPFDEATC